MTRIGAAVGALLMVFAGIVAPDVRGQAADSLQDATPDTTAAYQIYTSDGAAATLADIVAASDTVDVLFVGEVHDDPGAHALQDTLFARLIDRHHATRPLALSMEMLERDVQPVVDEYLAGRITESYFRDDARVGANYVQARRPLVERARRHDLPVLAANAPRRYVNLVARSGPAALDSLSAWAHPWMAPLPYPKASGAYRAKWEKRMREAMPPGHGTRRDSAAADTAASPQDAAPSDHPSPDTSSDAAASAPEGRGAPSHGTSPHAGMSRMLQAQALWDATMAYTLAEHLTRHPSALAMHVTGSFHVSRGTGTPEALRHYRPSARSLVVLVQPTDDPSSFDRSQHAGLGDFVVLTPARRVSSQQRMPGQP